MGVTLHYSEKRNRVYKRRFDYDEARRRYQNGETAVALAEEYGVTDRAIYRVVIPGEIERMNAYQNSFKGKGTCENCGAPTHGLSQRYKGTRYCRDCSTARRTAEHVAKTVRDSELWCTKCRAWHPDNAFGIYKKAPHYRRDRHTVCKAEVARQRTGRRHRAFAEGRTRSLA